MSTNLKERAQWRWIAGLSVTCGGLCVAIALVLTLRGCNGSRNLPEKYRPWTTEELVEEWRKEQARQPPQSPIRTMTEQFTTEEQALAKSVLIRDWKHLSDKSKMAIAEYAAALRFPSDTPKDRKFRVVFYVVIANERAKLEANHNLQVLESIFPEADRSILERDTL
jgi:hypothetical protein